MLVAVLGRCLPNGNSSFGKFEFEQARALQRHGKYDVVYCVSDNRSIRQNLYPRKTDGIINEVRYFERILPVGGLPYSIFNLVRFSSQCGLLNDIEMCVGKPDVLYAHFPGITLSQRFIREIKSRNINLVCLEHWTKVKNRTCGRARERTIRCAVKSSSSFLCVSNDLASSVMEICGEEDGISVIPNIIPDEFYKSYDSLKINPSDSLKETKFISVGLL